LNNQKNKLTESQLFHIKDENKIILEELEKIRIDLEYIKNILK